MKYTEVKLEKGEKIGDLCHRTGLFWAFSNKQFEEGKKENPIAENEKYMSIGMGGYLPSKNIDDWINGMKEIEEWEKEEIKKVESEEAILYELNNYECFYTGEIEPALDALLPLGYTKEQIKGVYFAHA
jgi:hypothetical protein